MDFKSILLAQKTGYIPRNHFDALFARKTGGAVLKDFPGLPASIVTVTDALAKPLDSLKVAITPIQSGSGDPSPDNIRPISGWTECNVTRCGKNLLNVVNDNLMMYTSQFSYFSVDDATNTITITGNALFGFVAEVTPNTTYRVSYKQSEKTLTTLRVREFSVKPSSYSQISGFITQSVDVGRTATVESAEFTTTNETRFIIAGIYRSGAINNLVVSEFQLNVGEEILEYEPYTGQDYTITFPSEAGTVYGGTLDVVNGTLTVTDVSVDLGDVTYRAATNNAYFYSTSLASVVKRPSSNSNLAEIICENYKNVSRDTLVDGSTDCVIAVNTSGVLQVRDSSYVEYTAEQFKTAMTGIKLVYALAEPITYQLTPTEVQMLLGTNNIWADTGDILEGKYYGKRSSETRAMLNTLRDAGEITELTEQEENDER